MKKLAEIFKVSPVDVQDYLLDALEELIDNGLKFKTLDKNLIVDGYIITWTWLRKLVRRRDDLTCQDCEAKASEHTYNNVHHIIPLGKGEDGKDNHPSNLVLLCPPCHAKRHRRRGA